MAHIATCMVEADLDRAAGPGNGHLITGLITKPPSPTPSSDSSSTSSQASEQKPHVWRMQQTQQQQPDVRKYQLFPKGRPQPAPVTKALDPEQARAYALGQAALSEKDKEKTSGGGLRVRIKEHNLIRRRKVSVPELGPMTTVQEVAMDSPSTSLTTPMSSTTTHSAVALPTPVSAPLHDVRASPKPSEVGAFTGSSSFNTTPKKEIESRAVPMGHRRGQSETGSIMERGRPRKRTDRKDGSVSAQRAESARTRSTDQKAFEELPSGCKASEAANQMNQIELLALQKQAFGQASRFEVLRKEDVESLSRELRQLDERTEYLRRTYHSLRAGRRNLHSRICQYLRSPRVARFSTDSMLKQEEALGELDASIDDWVNKLEHAENRRARVRQKLLEHVAAAAILPNMGCNPGE
ncbi:conserved hypothetical protein [Verticillium alfalfae VaMs.102]|uniref:Up-regulated during septation protein 1 domain-containing protein n=1 Tax=Verticillium alfalfae (strain VaMs.102 / ATCC MYA-4576 / FGSC 10136) TaxID=526221 RepID=C9S6B8_VERA1|nr:conserved hypothetical protein [Verticillium alfalfae VaMs.102]EEY14430.1 conserved hypothetical protein [Verticillium alfalfae VaMs.102]